MTVVCQFCWPRNPGGIRRNSPGKSRVVETRKVLARMKNTRGKRIRVRSIARVRACLKCGFRWKTIEVVDNRRD